MNLLTHTDITQLNEPEYVDTYLKRYALCGVDEILSYFLLSHAPAGMSRRYVARLILQSGQVMREAQRKISRPIVSLLEN